MTHALVRLIGWVTLYTHWSPVAIFKIPVLRNHNTNPNKLTSYMLTMVPFTQTNLALT